MAEYTLLGGCHCGSLAVEMILTQSPGAYAPRACDCGFCRKHGASYVSDPDGVLRIRVKDKRHLGRYRQGDGIAECLVCRNCGVLVAVVYFDAKRLLGTVNSNAIEEMRFGEPTRVSPRLLSDGRKVARWKEIWFSDVDIHIDGA
jgi:hypothetical protein